MEKKSLKSAGSTGSKLIGVPMRGRLATGFIGFPVAEEVGVTRYTRLAVGTALAVYAVYNEYTKKFTGLAVNDGTKYRPGSMMDLERALNESKGKK